LKRQICFPVILIWALVLFLHFPVAAQEYRARVQGSVIDASGARVIGATVVLTNVATGVKDTRKTDDTGHYIFDLVPPGTYTVEVEAAGFTKSVHEDVLVQSRGDVTVDANLQVGATREAIVVRDTAGQVEFNSAKAQITLDTQLVNDVPNFGRNPFLLAAIDPSVTFMEGGSIRPQDSWGSNGLRIAGGQEFSNDLQVDGSPITLGLKGSYVPNGASIQEMNIQQNAVDAEFGNSSGGLVSIAMKSGTNQFHGDAWYLGRYPWANALEDRHYRLVNTTRQNMFGADLGNPIKRNKLFNFFSFEKWIVSAPGELTESVPTPAQITGDFSQSKLANGDPLPIYDPFTTKVDASGNITRQPFANSIIPISQQDPIAVKLLTALKLSPNRTPDDPTGLHNFAVSAPAQTHYYNYSDRVDYYLSDKLRFNARASRFVDTDTEVNPTGSQLYQVQGSGREAYQFAGTMTYTLSARTVFDVHGDWHSFVDEALPPISVPGYNWQDLYAGQTTLLNAVVVPGMANPDRPPRIQISRNMGNDLVNFGDAEGYWYSHPEGHSIHGKMLHTFASHFVKVGAEYRYQYGKSVVMYNSGFNPTAASTSKTYVNPNTGLSGNGYASFLLGALGDPNDYYTGWGYGSVINQEIIYTPVSKFWSFYVNDDWKVNRNLTVTFGLRYEYELPWMDPENRSSRGLDLSETNATLAANPPQIDPATMALVRQYYTGPLNLTNGVWLFSTSGHPGMWNTLSNMFLPRIGVAYRLNDKTALRIAYARWAHPWVQQGRGLTGSLLDCVYPGYFSSQSPAPMIQGVPQATLSNPFPSTAPLIPASDQTFGGDYALGSSQEYWYQNRQKDTTDRMNFGYERQLPFGFVGKATYFLNFSHNLSWTENPNMMNPALTYNYQGALNVQVQNPFYMYGTPSTFPGPLRYQQTVPLGQLLRPYPQYGDQQQDYTPGLSYRYQSVQFDVRRVYQNGLSVFFAYNYHNEQTQYFYDNLAQYLQNWIWGPTSDPRHRISEAATWDLPIGKGRQYLSGIPRGLDLLVGGWSVGTVLTWHSGDFITFGGLLQVSDPAQNIPAGAYFNPAALQILPAYTERTNQNQYPGITGPSVFNLDASLNKSFSITEKYKLRLTMTAYNALNNFTLADPITDVTNLTQFGYTNGTEAANMFGRRMEFGLKFLF
jgi:hypothetical protein